MFRIKRGTECVPCQNEVQNMFRTKNKYKICFEPRTGTKYVPYQKGKKYSSCQKEVQIMFRAFIR